MTALQCDVSTPYNLCGVNTYFSPQTEYGACQERALYIGQMTTGTASAGVPVQVLQNEDELFGAGSMLAKMVKAARCTSNFSEIWALPIADSGTAGVAEVTFSGAAAALNGASIALVVNGEAYSVAFAPGDTDDMIAAAFAIAIDDDSLTVVAAGPVLTITTANGGDLGGAISVLTDYAALNIITPTEIGVAVTLTPGVGTPSLASVPLAALNGDPYTFIANPYHDAVSMQAIKAHICETWRPRVRVRSESFTVMGGAIADVQTAASLTQAPQVHLAYLAGTITPEYEVTAAMTAAAYALMNTCNDPLVLSNPICGEALSCVSTPDTRLTLETMDVLAGDGISLLGVNALGEVEITTFTGTYTVNEQGIQDDAFKDGQNVARLRYVSTFVEGQYQATYGRHALRSDDFSPRAGQRVATVWQIKAFMQSIGVQLSNRNIIEDPDGWSESVDVQWDGGNSCVNIQLFPDLVNKLCCTNLIINSKI